MSQRPPDTGAVRPAVARDLDRVAALWKLLADHHARLDPAFQPRPDGEDAIRRLLGAQLRDADAALWVWEREGDLSGFCAARVDRASPLLAESGRLEISELAVRESARRRGVGRALVETALGWGRERGVQRVEVRVATRNAAGQGFWRALGFGDLVDVLQRPI